MLNRDAVPSKPEERFVELFQDVFGPAAAAKLDFQVHFRDITGRDRYIDFALDSLLDRYALEIDGETYHHPAVLTPEDYEDQLLRQNSLIHNGWRVLRWTDRQIQDRPDTIKDHLAILLSQAVQLTVPQDYLPPKRASLLELHGHQAEALKNLADMRTAGGQIALLSHAVGTGKTSTAVEDARVLSLRTLFLAHTHELIDQALERFGQLWPEAARARLGDAEDERAQVVVGTVQFMAGNLARFDPRAFGYIVIDEAHHATAKSYRAVLRYFDPQFLLGLTGTPDRADGQNALEVFKQTAHHMDMETAVKGGVLCDVRAFRVDTNVDLSQVRFNGNLYNQKDLESRVSVPSRNQLIVDTYAANVPGRPAVTFCVSVAHAEEMARLFTAAGFAAKAVSGRLRREERQRILDEYDKGGIKVLCACDVLNEGWDAPQTEVLMMARPTLSKVIYQQQIGRGMRTHPGKEYLVLFDFVDVFGRHNEALSVHRVLRKAIYKAGSRLFGTNSPGETVELPLHLWASDYQPINIFDWQDQVADMLTAPALSRLLRKNEEWIGDKHKAGEIAADETINLGAGRAIPYFRKERVAELRERYGLREVTDENLFDDFLAFLSDMSMTYSYKPVWFLALLAHVDDNGKASVSSVTNAFWQFYKDRAASGLTVEHPTSLLSAPDSLTSSEVQQTINRGPFSRFSRLDYIDYARDKAFYQLHKAIWGRLQDQAQRTNAEELCRTRIEAYYKRNAVAGATVYPSQI
jgi:superfamily II DNA or RNA helicase